MFHICIYMISYGTIQKSQNSHTGTEEQAAIDKIQNENEALKAKNKSLELTIQTYQDEVYHFEFLVLNYIICICCDNPN